MRKQKETKKFLPKKKQFRAILDFQFHSKSKGSLDSLPRKMNLLLFL